METATIAVAKAAMIEVAAVMIKPLIAAEGEGAETEKAEPPAPIGINAIAIPVTTIAAIAIIRVTAIAAVIGIAAIAAIAVIIAVAGGVIACVTAATAEPGEEAKGSK
jgi:hypothetical protein